MSTSTAFLFDQQPFVERLAETIAWCMPRGLATDPRRSLRSEQLQPWVFAPGRPALVGNVVNNRAWALGTALDRVASHADLRGGRLLVYFPDQNLADGAAEAASLGFFDMENTPPWDTWVALGADGAAPYVSLQTYLVCWVPPALVELAGHGISVNPEACISWLEDAAVSARDELRGFLHPDG